MFKGWIGGMMQLGRGRALLCKILSTYSLLWFNGMAFCWVICIPRCIYTIIGVVILMGAFPEYMPVQQS